YPALKFFSQPFWARNVSRMKRISNREHFIPYLAARSRRDFAQRSSRREKNSSHFVRRFRPRCHGIEQPNAALSLDRWRSHPTLQPVYRPDLRAASFLSGGFPFEGLSVPAVCFRATGSPVSNQHITWILWGITIVLQL